MICVGKSSSKHLDICPARLPFPANSRTRSFFLDFPIVIARDNGITDGQVPEAIATGAPGWRIGMRTTATPP